MRIRLAIASLTLVSCVLIGANLVRGFAMGDEQSKAEQTPRECIEYQLFFKTMEVPPSASAEDYKEQKAGFDALGLNEKDARALGEAVGAFRDQYRKLQENHEKEGKSDTASAIAFSKQVDALVETIEATIKKSLSPQGLKAIANVISMDEELKRRADQYVRWRDLRKMQEENDRKAAEEKKKSGHDSVNGELPRL